MSPGSTAGNVPGIRVLILLSQFPQSWLILHLPVLSVTEETALRPIIGGAQAPGGASSEVAPVAVGGVPRPQGVRPALAPRRLTVQPGARHRYLGWVLLPFPSVKNRPGRFDF